MLIQTYLHTFFVICVSCAVLKRDSKSKVPPAEALEFMKKYGYLAQDDGNTAALYTEDGIAGTLKIVQKFGAIPETGQLDNATLKLMSSPRCGVPDILKNKNKRAKRYNLASEGWNKRQISYYISNWAPRLGEEAVNSLISKALKTWGSYGNLKFFRKNTPDADIIVSFGSGNHGDDFPFDGPGIVLAHAFFPAEESDLSGDIHFDNDENWIDIKANIFPPEEGTDFYSVALHELGHSLGLGHSMDPHAVMFPYYSGDENDDIQLGQDDIMAMYQLYILRPLAEGTDNILTTTEEPRTRPTPPRTYPTTARTPRTTTRIYPTPRTYTTPSRTSPTSPRTRPTPTRPTRPRTPVQYPTPRTTFQPTTPSYNTTPWYDGHRPPPTEAPKIPDICKGSFDAVALIRGELFVFKNEYIWRLYEKGLMLDRYHPITIKQMFPKLPQHVNHIDAVYEREDGNIILFIDDLFWVYDGSAFVENSPRPLSDYGLPANLGGIDAVQIWGKNHKVYLYKGDRFWRYNDTSKRMDSGYPRHINKWRGVPVNIDSATTWKDGITYFFKDELFWSFDNNWVMVTDESPLPAAQIWLGCEEDESVMKKLRS